MPIADSSHQPKPGGRGRRSFAYLFERFPSFVQTFVYREAYEMVRQGMDPMLISIRGAEDPLDQGCLQPGVTIDYLPDEKQLRHAIDHAKREGKLKRRAGKEIKRRRREPDSQRVFEAAYLQPLLSGRLETAHVHAHFGGMAARAAWWLKKIAGVPYSFTGHANDIFCEHTFPVTNTDLVRGAEFIVTETDYARRWMEQRYPFAKGKIIRVFNGIDLSGFPEREPSGDPPLILAVGRCVEKKGFNHLIDACRQMRNRGVRFTCRIVGGGPLEEALKAQARQLGLQDVVELAGPAPQEEVRALLARAAVFALPCVAEKDGGSDNLPTVIMEAMAAGCPVVSTTTAGVPEMIEDGVNGLLVPPGDPCPLAVALERIVAAPVFGEHLGAAAKQSAAEKFAIEKTTAELKHLLVERAGVIAPASARALDATLPSPSIWARWRSLLK